MKMHGTTTNAVRSLFAAAFTAVSLEWIPRRRIGARHRGRSTRSPKLVQCFRKARRELHVATDRSDRRSNRPSGARAQTHASQCSRHKVVHLRFPAPAERCHTIRVHGSTSLVYRQSAGTE